MSASSNLYFGPAGRVGEVASAFWSAAFSIDGDRVSHSYTGDLAAFGFVKDRSDKQLERLRDAMASVHEVLPDARLPNWAWPGVGQEKDAARAQALEQDEATLYWAHPSEDTLAITQPYSYVYPYGRAHVALFHFHALDDKREQNKRTQQFRTLKLAQQSGPPPSVMTRIDTFTAQADGFGGTFAFLRHRTNGGRDEDSRFARGFSLDKERAESRGSAKGVPFLYLEVGFNERSL